MDWTSPFYHEIVTCLVLQGIPAATVYEVLRALEVGGYDVVEDVALLIDTAPPMIVADLDTER